jgi:anti-sigma regulatory factor (Ser/Thr protein kinase)
MPETLEVLLPSSTAGAREARRLLREFAERVDLSSAHTDVVLLLASELVTNAVLHGRSNPRMTAVHDTTYLEVSVEDDNSRVPEVVDAAVDALGGRGLAIVELLSDEWGVKPTPGGKSVWFRLSLY